MTIHKAENEPLPVIEKIPYPSHPALKYAFKSPLLLWRMGLGPLLGRIFLILSTWGRKSGLARHTPLEYHTINGRLHIMAAWPNSDWYRNLQANPHVTVQTEAGSQSMIARPLRTDEEFSAVFDYVEARPTLRQIWEAMGIEFSREAFLAEKERFHVFALDPTTEPTPPPIEADLGWLWLVILALPLPFVFRRFVKSD